MNLPKAYRIITHQDAIEVLLIIAKQRLQREELTLKTGPGRGFRKEIEDNIQTLKKTIEQGHNYLASELPSMTDEKMSKPVYLATFKCNRFGTAFAPRHIHTNNLSAAKRVASTYATQKHHMKPLDDWFSHDNINHFRHFKCILGHSFKVNVRMVSI